MKSDGHIFAATQILSLVYKNRKDSNNEEFYSNLAQKAKNKDNEYFKGIYNAININTGSVAKSFLEEQIKSSKLGEEERENLKKAIDQNLETKKIKIRDEWKRLVVSEENLIDGIEYIRKHTNGEYDLIPKMDFSDLPSKWEDFEKWFESNGEEIESLWEILEPQSVSSVEGAPVLCDVGGYADEFEISLDDEDAFSHDDEDGFSLIDEEGFSLVDEDGITNNFKLS